MPVLTAVAIPAISSPGFAVSEDTGNIKRVFMDDVGKSSRTGRSEK